MKKDYFNLTIKLEYYKGIRKGKQPIKYHAEQPKGIGTDVKATIYLDPILKYHDDLRDALVNHEIREIITWAKGEKGAHTKARSQEPKAIRDIGGVSGFWKEIERRERKELSFKPQKVRITPKTPRLR